MPVKAKGSVITGEDARSKITDNLVKKSDLTVRNIEFVLTKLKTAQFQGSEFEHFYQVWVKLSAKLESLKSNKQA
ncbi:MAG: hypothetical protein ACKVJK_15625 [Methylophagaceae bacterium]|jgi:hypothetical protein|tara:strand:+ start:1613 stop:1837 length:225 start_codon:yes stop_codon:yes gene_type:complete